MTQATLDRRTRILVAAEKLFAMHGYDGTSLRSVAEEAGDVKLPLLVYHFESKLALYREIFARRQYVNEKRLDLLRAVDVTAADSIERIVDAFATPVLDLHDDPDDIWFARLVFREASDPSNVERGVIDEFFDPLAIEFVDAMRLALPNKPLGFHEWVYLFATGALAQSSSDARVSVIGRSSGGGDKKRFLKTFIVAGIRGE